MIWVVLVICVLLCVGGVLVADRSDAWVVGYAVSAIGFLVSIAAFVIAIIMSVELVESTVIDDKITMLCEENSRIETQLATIVEQYQSYETDVFQNVAPDSAMTMVVLYPELKSDTLVQAQMEVYVANNEAIKELRLEKLHEQIYRWWLFFGKMSKGVSE